MSFLTEDELAAVGFASIGRNVKVSRLASIHGAARISIGDNSRIDDFCVLSAGEGGIAIGRHVHIAVMVSILGSARVEMRDFSGLSARVSVYSSSDDYGGRAMTNPTVPAQFTSVKSREVIIGRHAIVGAGSVILPGVEIGDGAAVGAMSLVIGHLAENTIYGGTPAKALKPRRTDFYALEKQLHDRTG